jgi:uncharacterized membrane protein
VPLTFRRTCLLAALALLATFAPLARPALAINIVVANFNDSGAGSLRQAIIDANNSVGGDTITFSTAGTINLSTPLPALTGSNISIDGSVPAGTNVPKVELRGQGTVKGAGILIHSSGNIIRGLILNGFIKEDFGVSPDYGGAGVIISGSTNGVAANNIIEYNYIGTNAAGNAVGNAQDTNNVTAGVLMLLGASTNTIRNNVISGNGGATTNNGPGIYLTRDRNGTDTFTKNGNVIRDNLIGLTVDGGTALLNTGHGIWVGNNSLNTVIGPGNTISGNGGGTLGNTPFYGIQIQYEAPISPPAGVFFPSGTLVKGNRIGTNAAGNAAVPNKGGGVLVGVSTNTTIGGTSAADPNERNIISGNRNIASFGVSIEDYPNPPAGDTTQRTIGAVVQNNWIGIDASGTAALPNRPVGVLMRSHIRGARVGPGNVISGNGNPATNNGGNGVLMEITSSDVTNSRQSGSNEISGNLIGTGPDGNGGFAFQDNGIQLHGATTANVIKNNRITGNQVAGVSLQPNTGTNGPSANTIQDNSIGVTAAGGTPGNGAVGVQLVGAGNVVGPGNDIAGHATSGVEITTSQNTVKANTVRANQIGIQISNGATGNVIGGSAAGEGNNLINNALYGVYVNGAGTITNKITRTTTNNNGDKGIKLDTGGNAPIAGASLSNLALSGNNLSGSITNPAVCGGTCTIEVFTSNGALVDEGPVFLTSFTTTGSFSNVPLPDCQLYLIFTITDSAGNTSEFINPIGPFAQCVPAAPAVSITTDAPGASRGVVPGSSTTYLHTVTNSGTGPGAVSVSFSQTGNAWATLINNTCTGQILAPNDTCTFGVQVSVPAGTPAGQSNVSTIDVAIGSATGQQVDTTTALSNPALTFEPEPLGSNNQTVGSGQPVTYQHKLTNTGNGPDSFDITVTPPTGWTFTVQPANPIALAQGASAIVTVVLTPPAGIAAGPYPATVRATSRSSASVFADVIDTTTITAAAVPNITSVITPANADQGATVTIEYTVANVGNQDGTFTLTFTPPPGWNVTQAAPSSVTVPFSGPPATFSVILQVPAAAIAGAYQAKLTATATSAPNASATLTDQITVNQKAALTLEPDFNDPVLRAPNTVITYTNQLLTNNGNFTDTIHLTASTSIAGWSAQPVPATITLNPGASVIIPVVLTIPLGQLAGVENTTTVTATSSLPAAFDRTVIKTTIDNISGALFTPTLQSKVIDAGKPITFTYTLANSGSVPQSYTLTQAGAPGGWISTLTPASPTTTLAPGASQAVTLVLQAPAGTPDNTQATVTITAACVEKPCTPATATAKLTIGPPFSVGVGGNCDGPALPGAVLTCVHTVSNTGFSADTYLISTLSPLGWSTAVAPALLFLGAGASGTVTITLNVPSSAEAGLVHRLRFTARSTALPSVSQVLTDTTTVLQVAGVSFSPSRITPTIGGQLVEFQHTVLNTGNGLDTYTITATQTLDWKITIVPTTTVALARGTYQTIQVLVQVPAGASPIDHNEIILQATSKFAPAIFEKLEDRIGTFGDGPPRPLRVYLPVQR